MILVNCVSLKDTNSNGGYFGEKDEERWGTNAWHILGKATRLPTGNWQHFKKILGDKIDQMTLQHWGCSRWSCLRYHVLAPWRDRHLHTSWNETKLTQQNKSVSNLMVAAPCSNRSGDSTQSWMPRRVGNLQAAKREPDPPLAGDIVNIRSGKAFMIRWGL